jgi:hypothetical protein
MYIKIDQKQRFYEFKHIIYFGCQSEGEKNGK